MRRELNYYIQKYEIIEDMIKYKPLFWENPKIEEYLKCKDNMPFTLEDMTEAECRLKKFSTFLMNEFPELKNTGGIIESPLKEIENMKEYFRKDLGININGTLLMKCDSELKVAGSIKARGGIYEVLKHAETLALENGIIDDNSKYEIFGTEKIKNFLSGYKVEVGSTGNLGLSIGIMSAAMGFKAIIHMSQEAKQWKKDLLRSKGVEVREYSSDFTKAVEEGRKSSLEDPKSYFVDDEKSKDLFMGYAVAAFRLKEQLDNLNVIVDKTHPLIVYLPSGVGGGPGGITFGLKAIYGDNVRCYFGEPTHAPAMMLGLITGEHDEIKVQDLGIDNITEADGLAVGCPSALVSKFIGPWISGCYTVEDSELYPILKELKDREGLIIEPSSAAAFLGLKRMAENHIEDINIEGATHIAWATGGLFLPKEMFEEYYIKGNNKK